LHQPQSVGIIVDHQNGHLFGSRQGELGTEGVLLPIARQQFQRTSRQSSQLPSHLKALRVLFRQSRSCDLTPGGADPDDYVPAAPLRFNEDLAAWRAAHGCRKQIEQRLAYRRKLHCQARQVIGHAA